MTDHAVPEPLNAEEEAALRAEAESEKNDPDLRHATWQRLILRMFATLDARQSAITEASARVYAVVYSNYSPAEIDSLWARREDAEAHAESLDGPWDVQEWTVRSVLTSGEAP
jgi:hypothetical protein